MLLILLLVAFCLAGFYFYVQSSFCYWKNRGVPYAQPRFPFGTLAYERANTDFLRNLYKKYKGKFPFVGLFFAIKPAILAIDPDLIKRILFTDFSSFHDRGIYFNEEKDPLSAHLFTQEGQKWASLRQKLTPTFTSGKIKSMFPILESVAQELVRKVSEETEDVEMTDLLARYSTDIIGNCAFGLDCNSLRDPRAEFREMGRRFTSAPRNSRIKTFLLLSFKRLGKLLGQKSLRDDVTQFVSRIVRETIEYRERNSVCRTDFLDLLIKLKNSENPRERLTLDEIAAQALVFYIGGFETSSVATSFTLFELASNPEVQEKARKCVQESLRKHGKFTYEALKEMSYVHFCISESLRKYPPAVNLIRVATKDFAYDGHIIEKGTSVLISLFSLHRDPDVFPEPEKFIPERFEASKRDSIFYMPFGEGPRICIGQRFALLVTSMAVASLLHRFRITLSPKTKSPLAFSDSSFVLSPKGGLHFHFRDVKSVNHR